jgi:hypothetical protein
VPGGESSIFLLRNREALSRVVTYIPCADETTLAGTRFRPGATEHHSLRKDAAMEPSSPHLMNTVVS